MILFAVWPHLFTLLTFTKIFIGNHFENWQTFAKMTLFHDNRFIRSWEQSQWLSNHIITSLIEFITTLIVAKMRGCNLWFFRICNFDHIIISVSTYMNMTSVITHACTFELYSTLLLVPTKWKPKGGIKIKGTDNVHSGIPQ